MDLRRIRELTDAFEASDWDEIDLEIDGVCIQLSTRAHVGEPPAVPAGPSNERGAGADEANERHIRDAGAAGGAPSAANDSGTGADEANERHIRDAGAAGGAPSAANDNGTGADEANERHTRGAGAGAVGPAGDGGPADKPAEVPAGADGTPVTAPSPGIFWRAPSPGEPPFVEVGDRVEPDTVVCIVELMKLMNRVVAGVSGTVTAVLADNGQSVDKGGSLVLVAELAERASAQ